MIHPNTSGNETNQKWKEARNEKTPEQNKTRGLLT